MDVADQRHRELVGQDNEVLHLNDNVEHILINMTTAYLFCYNLFNNLVKARQVENITDSTQFVVNFRRLKLEQVT